MAQFTEIKPCELNDNTFHLIGNDWMLVTAEKDGKVNTMTASWGGLGVMWGKDVAFTVIRPQRYTKEFIDANTHYSLTFYDKQYRDKLSYLGSVSGRTEDKISKSELTLINDSSAPYFGEAKLVLICKKLLVQPLEETSFLDPALVDRWYPHKDFHVLYIAEIEKVLIQS